MPYKSKAQQKFLHSQKPELAAKWDKKYPAPKSLPEKAAKPKAAPKPKK